MGNNQMHNDSLQLFQEKVFEGILNPENVIGKKTAITVDKIKYYGYFLEKDKVTYFLQDLDGEASVLDLLPIKITRKSETDFARQVFFFIEVYSSVKIPISQQMSFKELIDTLANFKHTNARHWLLYKIINTVGWTDRINYRVIAERGFGKDSVINNTKDLVGSVANIYGATFAKLEYSLLNKQLIFNEMGNLKADDKQNMQQFLLAIGAMFNTYTKRSRAGDGTREEYDISKQSLGIIYNPPIYYIERGQEFFDIMFTKAVPNRFIPFYLEGTLDEKFDAEFDVESVVAENMNTYKKVISTLLWYRNNTITNKFDIPDDITFGEKFRRYERSFLKICDYLSEYADGDEEVYYQLVYELYGTYKKFNNILSESLMKQR